MLFDFNNYIDNTAIITDDGREISYKELDSFSSEFGEKIKNEL